MLGRHQVVEAQRPQLNLPAQNLAVAAAPPAADSGLLDRRREAFG